MKYAYGYKAIKVTGGVGRDEFIKAIKATGGVGRDRFLKATRLSRRLEG